MKKNRISINTNESEWNLITECAHKFSMNRGEFLKECFGTYLKLVNLAKNEGNEYQDIPEAIDEMFECQATEDSLKMFFEEFAKKQKKKLNN